MKIFIVVPAYNEEKRIGEVLISLKKLKLTVIVVDDGSSDKTFNVAGKHNVTAIRHKVNLGKGAALKTGCEKAFGMGAEAVILMDSDGQHKTEDIPKFIEALEEGISVVFGTRNYSMGVPLIRYMGNKAASVLVALLFGIYVSDLICGYRGFTRVAYKKIKWQSTGYGVETEMVIRVGKAGLSSCEVPVETVYYDKFKGVTMLDALDIFVNVIKWRFSK